MRSILLDTGPLIALFAVDDKHHQHYDQLVTDMSATGLRLLTTWPCIVETSYLLDIPQRFEMLHWIELGGALVHPFEPHHLGDIIPPTTDGKSLNAPQPLQVAAWRVLGGCQSPLSGIGPLCQ